MNSEFTPENTRSNALFASDAALDAVSTPGGDAPRDGFEFEALKDPRIDWGAIARCDSRDARRRRDIDALESVLEACVRADVDSVTNQDMCEPKRPKHVPKTCRKKSKNPPKNFPKPFKYQP